MFASILTALISIFKAIPQLSHIADKLIDYQREEAERKRSSEALKRKDEKNKQVDDWFNN